MTSKTKPAMTAAEARALADQLAADEAEAARAEREARAKARTAKAHQLLGTVVDGQLKAARDDAEKAAREARTADPLDITEALRLHVAHTVADYVHADASDYLVTEIWQHTGQPMRPNPGSAASPAHVRPRRQVTNPVATSPGLAGWLDTLAHDTREAAAAKVRADLAAQLTDAETKPPVEYTVNPVTFRADKALTFEDAVFTARFRDGYPDRSGYYFTTADPGQIERLRNTPGVTEATDNTETDD